VAGDLGGQAVETARRLTIPWRRKGAIQSVPNLTDQGYWRRLSAGKLQRTTISLELYPPLYLVIDLSRFLIHFIPDFIAVLAFEK
jgi:hypothetical protein